MASRTYRVLLIDDDALVLERVRDRLRRTQQKLFGVDWHLFVTTVHISLEHRGESYVFSRATLHAIAQAAQTGVDLVVTDYGFVSGTSMAEVRRAAEDAGRSNVSADDVRGRVLTTEDLAAALREYAIETGNEAVRRAFFSSDRPLPAILYSYTSADFTPIYRGIDVRRNRTEAAFPSLTVTALDSRLELYNGDEFDTLTRSKHSSDYYSFLVSGLLILLIRERFLLHLLSVVDGHGGVVPRADTDQQPAIQPGNPPDIDVFLSYNSADRAEVRRVNAHLKAAGLRTWLDEERLRPGETWQVELENQLAAVPAACVFVGASGLGPWHNLEVRSLLLELVDRRCRVIPVLLPGANGLPELPRFLRQVMAVDLRDDPEVGMFRLVEVLRQTSLRSA